MGRAPENNLQSWVPALLLASLLLGGSEVFWRSNGHVATLRDSKSNWALHRTSIRSGESNEFVILGASFIQLGFDTATFRNRCPEIRLTQLALNGGGSSLPVLQDLAHDVGFTGTVLCSMHEQWFENWNGSIQSGYVGYVQNNYTFTAALEESLGASVRAQSVVLSAPAVRPDNVFRNVIRGRGLPSPGYTQLLPDRSMLADYTKTDSDEIRCEAFSHNEGHSGFSSTFPGWENVKFPDVEKWVNQIASRGGQVIFVKMPISNVVEPFSSQKTSGSRLWQQFARSTSATVINCRDYSRFDDLEFSDPGHLDFRESPIFTNKLLDLLVERKVLPISLGTSAL